MTQSTCRVSDNVTVQTLMPLCEAEHMTPVSAACAVVDGLAALPQPASAVQRASVVAVRGGAYGVSHWFHSFP